MSPATAQCQGKHDPSEGIPRAVHLQGPSLCPYQYKWETGRHVFYKAKKHAHRLVLKDTSPHLRVQCKTEDLQSTMCAVKERVCTKASTTLERHLSLASCSTETYAEGNRAQSSDHCLLQARNRVAHIISAATGFLIYMYTQYNTSMTE